jgi:hypothetical protein
MIRTDASGMRTSFPSNHYAAKQYTDPVSGNVHGNICLEEVQFSWTEDSLGPPASGQKRKHPGLQNVYHGTRAVWDRMHAARLNLMQGNTDILDEDFPSLHSRIPSFAGTTEVAATPCPLLTATATATGTPTTDGDAAYGDAADTAANADTTVDEGTASPDISFGASCGTIDCTIGPSAGPTSTGARGLAQEQFSTLGQVALYHRIMSEQFIVGQEVSVQYGTNCSEYWFPAVIRLKNSDGTYQITYIDFDESDLTASKKIPERIKAYCDDHLCHDVEYYDLDDEYADDDYADDDYDDDDYADDDYADDDYADDDADHKIINCRPRKSVVPSSDEVIEMSRRSGRITKFPPRRKTMYHPVRSRLPVDTTVFVKRSPDGPVLTGVIRQIMQDPQMKERFRYFIRSKPRFAQYYEEIWEEDFLIDCQNGTRWATINSLPSSPEAEVPPRPSSSSTHSDVYLMLTTDQVMKKWPPLTCRMSDFTRGRQERVNIINVFEERCGDAKFRVEQRKFLSELSCALDDYVNTLEESMKPPRAGWAHWVPSNVGDLWHLFQLTALLVNTSGTGDEVVKQSISELFRHTSSVCGGKFDNPFTFARDPGGAFTFLNARAKGSTTVSHGAPGISHGFNFGTTKALNLIKIAKQLILYKYCDLEDLHFHDIVKEIGSCYDYDPPLPLPDYIINKVPDDIRLFPACLDVKFLSRLQGVGEKMTNLIAEAGYQQLEVGGKH